MIRSVFCTLALIAAVAFAAPLAPASAQPPAPPTPPAAAPASPAAAPHELTDKPWLYEVVRHVYRWYVDERDIDAVIKSGEVVFWVRETKPKLDQDDHSRFGEVIMPQFALLIKVKKADYTIPELNVRVKGDDFKIVSVAPIERPEAIPAGYSETRANYIEMRDHLFQTRKLAAFPEGELLDRLRAAMRAEIGKDYAERHEPLPQGAQTAFTAALSPVANEVWAFWENGRMLVRFASDIDLADPAVWQHEKLTVRAYHVDRNVVVSLDEVGGSNAFMTRNQAGRALFNCIVLGKKLELTPGVPAAKPK